MKTINYQNLNEKRNEKIKEYYKTHSLRVTGKKFGLSHERIRQILYGVSYLKNQGHIHSPRKKLKI